MNQPSTPRIHGPSRRDFMGLPGLALFAQAGRSAGPPLKVVCVGGHPDDPESGCGGTLARYSESGHRVTIVYLTRGEHGIPGKSYDEAGAIRTREAEAACKILGATPVFGGQVNGAIELNEGRAESFLKNI